MCNDGGESSAADLDLVISSQLEEDSGELDTGNIEHHKFGMNFEWNQLNHY